MLAYSDPSDTEIPFHKHCSEPLHSNGCLHLIWPKAAPKLKSAFSPHRVQLMAPEKCSGRFFSYMTFFKKNHVLT
jgi:hypothetical protein